MEEINMEVKKEDSGWILNLTIVEEVKPNYKYMETRVNGVKKLEIDGDELVTQYKDYYEDDEDQLIYFDLNKITKIKIKIKKDYWVFK